MSTAAFRNIGDSLAALGQRVLRLGWPAVLACVLLLAAFASLAGAWYAHTQLLETNRSIAAMQRAQKTVVRNLPASNEPLPLAPPDALFLDDLRAIFALAKKFGVALGVVEYKTERSDKLPLTMRTIELKVKEDYPKIKSFLSQLLADLPFASLQEIRVERTDGLATQGTLLIRLMLVYKSQDIGADSASSPAPGAK
jgi:hypothetical protein